MGLNLGSENGLAKIRDQESGFSQEDIKGKTILSAICRAVWPQVTSILASWAGVSSFLGLDRGLAYNISHKFKGQYFEKQVRLTKFPRPFIVCVYGFLFNENAKLIKSDIGFIQKRPALVTFLYGL